MTASTVVAVVVWLLLGLAAVGTWWPPVPELAIGSSRRRQTGAVVVVVAGTGVVALLGALGRGAGGPLAWTAVGAGALAAAALGAVLTRCLLVLAAGAATPGARARPTVLRGGAWIGVLERLALFATLLAGFPMGLVAIVAVKAFARYPELKTAQATGAIERFIIGTFASLGWAALCAGVVSVLVHGSP